MNGFKLGNLAAGTGTTAVGIFANQKRNITIRNGIIRGFLWGIRLDDNSPYTDSSGHLIEDIRADGNTRIGMWVEGTGNVIRNNQVVSTGGSTTGQTGAFGIIVEGPGARAINNDVTDTAGGAGFGVGIRLGDCDNCVVEGNRVSDTSSDDTSFGIDILGGSANAMVVDNRIATADNGVLYSGSTGKYRDNITDGIGITPYSGGTDIGNNN
jgi:hypothetical protein